MKKTVKAVGYLTVLKILGSIIGLIYAVLQVRYFGASALMDTFFVATSAVYLVTSLTQGGQLAEVFLPEYLHQKENFNTQEASKLLSATINRIVVYLSLALVVLYVVAPIIILLMGPGLSSELQVTGVALFRGSLVLILFNIVASFVNTTLNAEQVFGRAEWTGIINGFLSIGIVVFFFESQGIWVLIYALIAGKIVEFLIGLIFLTNIGFKYHLIWEVPNYNLSNFFRIMITTSGYVGATQIYNITLTAMASLLPEGSFSVFNYVKQLSTKTRGIIIGPISTVFFTKFTKIVVEKKENLTSYLVTPLIGLLVVAFLQLCAIILVGEEFLKLLWSKKTLSQEYFSLAYFMLLLNITGVIFSAIGMIFRKSAVALGASKQLYQHWSLIQLFTAAYSFIVVYVFGVYGLATIILVNMFLMALVSYNVSLSSGIKGATIWKKILNDKALLLFFSFCFLGVLFIKDVHIQAISDVYNLIVKLSVYATLIVGLILFLFWSRIAEVLKTWNSNRGVKS